MYAVREVKDFTFVVDVLRQQQLLLVTEALVLAPEDHCAVGLKIINTDTGLSL